MKVLIVEDNPVNAELIQHTLERERYQTVMAEDGEIALTQIDTHPDIDLVITDVNMPKMNGLEMIQLIRQRPEHLMLPIVVATALANHATIRQAFSLQCKHLLVKPFTLKLLLQSVREALRQRGLVLQDKGDVLRRLGISGAGYDQMALSFATLVHASVSALKETCERDQPVEFDQSLRQDLLALEESAGVIGAERIGRLLNALRLPGGTIPTNAMGLAYNAILVELRILAGALPTQESMENPVSAESPATT